MVKPITTYVTQKSLLWYGHVMTRDGTNVAEDITTMNVGGKRPRGRPRLRWMDRVLSDLKHTRLIQSHLHDTMHDVNQCAVIGGGQDMRYNEALPCFDRQMHTSMHVCACMCVLAYRHLIQLLQSQTRIS